MSRQREVANNHTVKRGLVIERDGPNQRVRVEFPDEDAVRSPWIDVVSKGSSRNADFDMPDEGDEVWCGLDPSGESGCLIGTRYNAVDRPRETNPDKKRRDFADGSFITHDPATGTHTMEFTAKLVLKVGASIITVLPGEVIIQTPKLTGQR